jgi:hypothetical protein
MPWRRLAKLYGNVVTDERPSAESVQVVRLTSGGYELRVMKELLLELDPNQTFRGLSKVFAEGGDVLWVCSQHYRRHDPGLPALPYPDNAAIVQGE